LEARVNSDLFGAIALAMTLITVFFDLIDYEKASLVRRVPWQRPETKNNGLDTRCF
jgi:hypothetical protein